MKKIYILTFIISFVIAACENPLEEEVFSDLGPSNFFNSADDAEALLYAAYAASQVSGDRDYILLAELPSDILIEREGGLRRTAQLIEDFTWDATHPYLSGMWDRHYQMIYRANVVLDNVPDIEMNENRKQQILAEARFIRALSYFYLYDFFGPTPLVLSSEVSIDDRPERATREEFISFVESEFQAVSEILPATQDQYPRATSGAALGFLTKFYLNNKMWQEAAETAQEVISSNTYVLFDGENRTDLFALENERNSEFIFVRPHIPQPGFGNGYIAHAAPPNYQFQYPPKENFAAQYKILSSFINTFDPQDERLGAFVFEYTNTFGEQVVLGEDDVRSFKYPEDPNCTGRDCGNDVSILRYADILLSRAEALNEMDGPTQEAIDLINQVRAVAGVPLLDLGGFSSKEALREHILAERGWEFHTEELRRQDLIRHGKFIERAIERGKMAFDYHVLYPIPQSEIDRNPNLVQNDGY
ncbi:RagB/SusD family nutrient uptake outer membrane protein [Catalinimonas sp. 4WD22]|uniref:RagB/SusD family nutrient uptake outer membrane protein n=1 Tax=Catalinimonas locisalis TaxID=3133978 RepID=UPI003100D7A5